MDALYHHPQTADHVPRYFRRLACYGWGLCKADCCINQVLGWSRCHLASANQRKERIPNWQTTSKASSAFTTMIVFIVIIIIAVVLILVAVKNSPMPNEPTTTTSTGLHNKTLPMLAFQQRSKTRLLLWRITVRCLNYKKMDTEDICQYLRVDEASISAVEAGQFRGISKNHQQHEERHVSMRHRCRWWYGGCASIGECRSR